MNKCLTGKANKPLETEHFRSTYMTFVNIIKLKNAVNFPSPKHVFPCFPVSINASQLSKPETLQSGDSPSHPPLSMSKYCFFFLCLFPGPITLDQVTVSLLSYNSEARLLFRFCALPVCFSL